MALVVAGVQNCFQEVGQWSGDVPEAMDKAAKEVGKSKEAL